MTSTVTIEQTSQTTAQNPAKQAAIYALATVGFVALLILGITLAIYSSRYVPLAVSKLAGDLNGSNNSGSLSVVSATSTIPFGNNGDVMTATTTTTLTPPVTTNAQTAVATPATTESQSEVSQPRGPYGLPDLAVTIIATGYLTTNSTASFVPANIIPPGARPAVQFSIANDGTNVTGPWNFLAQIPSYNNYVFNSPIEPSLNPGDHTVFTLGFNEAIPGPAQTITIVADPNDNIVESNEGNNSAAAAVTITATGN